MSFPTKNNSCHSALAALRLSIAAASLGLTAVAFADEHLTFGDASVDPQIYQVGTRIEDLHLPSATGGRGFATYALSPALPLGLVFNQSICLLTGTPAQALEQTTYTLTATDRGGNTATLDFTIEVQQDLKPTFGDASIDGQTYRVGSPIDALTLPMASGGDGALTYALTPALPAGLTFNAGTRMLAGTPEEASARASYALTATDEDGDVARLQFMLEVQPDRMPTFGDAAVEPQVYRVGSPIDELTLPMASSGDGELSYTLAPAPPTGLTFNARTRKLTGTPEETSARASYALTATDEDGDTARLQFMLEVEPDMMPTFGDAAVEPQVYRVGSPIDELALPMASDGDGELSYALTPALPAGLSFDAGTRTLAGTPEGTSARASYALTATDEDGDTARLQFMLEVEPDMMPTFGDAAVEPQVYRVGSPIDELALPMASDGDGELSYALTPALPAGLSFDAGTRTLAGTPEGTSARASYALTATDEDGDVARLEFMLEVEPDMMPTFGDAAVAPKSYHAGTAIVDLMLPAASGGDGQLMYMLAPVPPMGLTFESAALSITGTPEVESPATEYTLTATDEDGDTATLRFTIEVGMAITVSIAASASAPEGQTLSFPVTLSDSAEVPITVAYATADGTARAGEDYTAMSGTLTFAAGETSLAINVAVMADPRPEHDETFSIRLSNPVNASLGNATATGTIADDDTEQVRGDALSKSLAAFGRSVASDAVDTVAGRFQEGPPVGSRATIGGRQFNFGSASGSAGAKGQLGQAAAAVLSAFASSRTPSGYYTGAVDPGFGAFGAAHSPGIGAFGRAPANWRASSFDLNFGGSTADAASPWTLWGRASANRFSGQPDDVQLDGDVNTGYLGIDALLPRNVRVGLAVARSSGEIDYRMAGVTDGELDLQLTSILPYVHWTLCNGVDLWAMAGSGSGEATLMDEVGEVDSDIAMRLAAFGVRQELNAWRGLDMAVKADAFTASLDADAVPDELAKAEADVRRIRVMLEGRRELQSDERSRLGANIELGGRLDGGDAETGFGTEVGGGLEFRHVAGLSLLAKGRYLLAHSESEFEDWGVSVALELDPGAAGSGATFRLAPAWGTPASDAASLWRSERLIGQRLGLRRPDSARLDMELGYGFALPEAGRVRLYGALSGDALYGRHYRFGGLSESFAGLQWSLELDRAQRQDGRPDHGILLTIGRGPLAAGTSSLRYGTPVQTTR